jgi:spore germination cell wall hydrolase CwlJ-like protein
VPELPDPKDITGSLPPAGDDAIDATPERPELDAAPETDESDDGASIESGPADAFVAELNPANQTAQLFFGTQPMSVAPGGIVPWQHGENPKVEFPEIKFASLPPSERAIDEKYAPRASIKAEPVEAKDGHTIAPKGQVTGPEQRPKSPAEILGLSGASREKAEKCLAEAVYFESRGEPVTGQIGVAQVVLNRVFHYHYPKTVCGVVYQNKHRHLACQFTFACDKVRDVVTEPDAWERAKTIARDTLDGKLWVAEIGKATHYHAYWVRPSWVNEMKRLHKLGVHSFYRPRNWGNGDDQPSWGSVIATQEAVKKL